VRSGALAVNDGTLRAVPNGTATGVSRVASLTIGAARLDLTDNKLIVDTGAIGTFSPITGRYDGIIGLVDVGRGPGSTGQWDGVGIVTSDTRAVNNADRCSIGVASAAQARNIAATATGIWAGMEVQGTSTLLMFTWGGDANLDGKINIDDYGQIDSNVNKSGTVFGWYVGDFNYDGKINIDDYGIIDANIGLQGPPFFAGSSAVLDGVAAVPEPAAAGMLVSLAAAATTRVRRRR
jgi:hypothetical protein